MNEQLEKLCRAVRQGETHPMVTMTVNDRTVFAMVRINGPDCELQIGTPPPNYNKIKTYIKRNGTSYEISYSDDKLINSIVAELLNGLWRK